MNERTDFVDVFRRHRFANSAKPALVFLRESGTGMTEETLTYGELDSHARGVASWLFANTTFGDRAILLFPAGPQFVVAFLGCLYAGVVGVPAPLPGGSGNGLARLRGITRDAGAQVMLTECGLIDSMDDWISQEVLPTNVPYAATDAMLDGTTGELEPPRPDSGAIAFLQYTSGSTSTPKGVMVTHGNLAHNELRMQRALHTDTGTSIAGWLPHYHDMGLIGQLLHALYVGGTVYSMSPLTFLKRPYRWLWAISKYRCTVSAAPDFAFDLTVHSVTDDQLSKLDLSSLKVLCDGAEPIQHRTLRSFTRRFRQVGLSERAIVPCYGLAESTLFVAGTGDRKPVTRGSNPGKVLVSSGTPADDMIRIVDADTHEVLPPGSQGEIWLRGGSVAAGYWNQPGLTERVFHAATSCGDGEFLRTGDLGVIEDGELYVIGRLNDVLIVNGRNIYPTDIEHAARQAHPALDIGRAAAFGAGSRRDQPVLVHEISTRRLGGTSVNELIRLIREKVRTEVDVQLTRIVLVPSGGVAVTTSGKVQRGLMRERFMAGGLKAHPLAEAPAKVGP